MPADFNHDGDVDSADLTVWESSFGGGVGADADSDGDSDGEDFLIWQRQYTGTAATPAFTFVPEPATGSLLFGGALGFAASSYRRQSKERET
ncbi:PEP-CTERM sorting domain-containing protein [Adhaeretor mobilis]|uniref:Ice-binding protein C-terminal domain-containing protein n=1 Tax=Adhaeretor mobilis TaxID=1930276 RepID=A0A517MS10_9BACT|nr:PEP-CTERM sorting domain-containing protein [Adhaeretor mobilis]QDS97665.1 hypothetical protein HG15A2_09290 [Adhaeretor mobilis]